MCRPCSLGDRPREATRARRPRHLPLARARHDLRLRPSPVTPSRQVLPARSSLPSVRLLPLFRVGRPLQWIARAPSGGGAANTARVGSLYERRDKPRPMTRTCCIVACHSVHARAWPATQRIQREVFVPRSGCTSSGRASWLCMFDNTVSLHFAPSMLLRLQMFARHMRQRVNLGSAAGGVSPLITTVLEHFWLVVSSYRSEKYESVWMMTFPVY